MSSSFLSGFIPQLFSGGETKLRQWFLNQAQTGKEIQLVFTPNPEQIVMAEESAVFRSCLESGNIFLPDGVGLVLASRWKNHPVQKITGVDTLAWWLKAGVHEKIPTLLIGGREGVAELLAKKSNPEGDWCWGIEGHVNVALPNADEEGAFFELVREKKPKVIFVAFGAPWQEEFLCRHKEKLEDLGVRVAMVCGGAFDSLTGLVPRAPKAVQDIGLEWLYRLVKEPWRWKRQLRLVKFLRLISEY